MYRKKYRKGTTCSPHCMVHHTTARAFKAHQKELWRTVFPAGGPYRIIVSSTSGREHHVSCRRPGEYKPGGGRYEKKVCLPRRKPKKKCHRAGQFKPGGGRYVTTPCGRKKRTRKRSVRGSAGASI